MTAFFLDSSALARRYFVQESGSGRVKALLSDSNLVLASQLASIEFASALARRAREGTIGDPERGRIWHAFQARLQAGVRVMTIDREVVAGAERLHLEQSLRALDSIHIASAQIAARLALQADESLLFVTADQRQARAAAAVGLVVELFR